MGGEAYDGGRVPPSYVSFWGRVCEKRQFNSACQKRRFHSFTPEIVTAHQLRIDPFEGSRRGVDRELSSGSGYGLHWPPMKEGRPEKPGNELSRSVQRNWTERLSRETRSFTP